MQRTLAILLTVLGTLIMSESVPALEEPDYTVEAKTDIYELRRYESYLVAETRIAPGERRADSKAFRILAGYIFGDNQSGEKMAMTAPVVSSLDEEETQVYQFVMESAYSLDSLPVPVDERVDIYRVPERQVAAITFSGRWSEKNVREHTLELLEAVQADGFVPVAEPLLARYNAPFTPWFMRRNEILVEVRIPGLAQN